VILKPLHHRGKECIGIYSPQHATLNHCYQKHAGAKWSRTNKCWYIPCTEKNYEQLAKVLKGKAVLDLKELKSYLLNKKKNSATGKPQVAPAIISVAKKETKSPLLEKITPVRISKENNEALQKFKQQLILKSYSPSTIRTYENEFRQFLQTIKDVPATDFTTQRIKDYLQYCFEKLKLSENTLHSRMNALKFYYEQVLHWEKFFWVYPVGFKKYLKCIITFTFY